MKHLTDLSSLRSISLGGAQITDIVSTTWTIPASLEELHLRGTSLSEAGFKDLRQANPDVQITH